MNKNKLIRSWFIQRREGLTLVEVMISMSIVVLSILTLSVAWSSNYGRLGKIRIYHDMAYLLNIQMKEFEMRFRGVSIDRIPDEESGTFEDEFSKYSWKFESQSLEFPDLTSLLLEENQTINEYQMQILTDVKKRLESSIKEARLSVFIRVNNREFKKSVATYFVQNKSN